METKVSKAEERLIEAQHAVWEEERRKRKAKALADLAMFPEGWEDKVTEAVLTAIKAGEDHATIDLVEFSAETRKSVSVSVSIRTFAHDYSDAWRRDFPSD